MNSLKLLELIKKVLCDPETLLSAKLKASAFTRNRKMSFIRALCFLLDMRKTTLQTRLNIFPQKTKEDEPISQQAFSKLRANFDHSPLETMVRVQVREEYSGKYELPLWHGFHLFGIDGTYLQLPMDDILAAKYGIRGRGDRPSAGVSVLYDVLHGWALDPIITTTNMNERDECEKHINFLCQQYPHIARNSIILIDRGYPSLDLLKIFQNSVLKYLVRCSSKFISEINDAPLGDSIVVLRNGVRVRVIKFVLLSGEIEILATNLFELPESQFPELYSLRWGKMPISAFYTIYRYSRYADISANIQIQRT